MTTGRLGVRGALLLGLITGVATPAADATHTIPSPAIGAQAGDTITMLLAEVRFDPNPGDTAFVELLNAGTTKVDLLRFMLRVGGSILPLPRLADSLAPGARLMVRFDGSGRTEKGEVHAGANYQLAPDSGSIELLSDDGRRLDRVAWGTSPDAVSPGDGGYVHAVLERGSSVGRPPGANWPGSTADWVVYAPAQVTPGQPNPLPAVDQLLPLDGVVIEEPTVDLAWYPVPGAVRYRVQVAADSTFARPVLDQTVATPEVPAARLALGAYVWRVQAIDAQGNGAAWSDLSVLELASPGDAPGPPEPASGGPSDAPAAELGSQPLILAVPYLTQHKDTKMLLIEEPEEQGQHAWDVDHRYPSRIDKADTQNCALANIAMVNHFFGGDLSQDRIGYEVLSRNVVKYVGPVSNAPVYVAPTYLTLGQIPGTQIPARLKEVEPGPERDLVYGRGLDVVHVVAAITYALGAAPEIVLAYQTKTDFWNDVTAEIKRGRPVIGANWHHAFVIKGYQLVGRRRFIYINDPANGQQRIDIDAARLPPSQLTTFKFLAQLRVARQEPEVTRDSDGDGVVDFDELERFKTNPMNFDTDADGVYDKYDIKSGVFEKEFGYGYVWNPGPNSFGRDYDQDGLPTEIDADSDWPVGGRRLRGGPPVSDGCLDGDEDKNGDGVRNPSESSNFSAIDDKCARLSGVLAYSVAMDNPTPTSVGKSTEESVVVHVKLKPDPNDSQGHYIDDGSTFVAHFNAHMQIDTGDPACTIWANEWMSASGPFNQPNDDVGGYRADDGTLSVGIKADRPTQTFGNTCTQGSGSGQGEHAINLGDCTGNLNTTQAGQRTYLFTCATKPRPAMGWNVSRYYVTGYVRVR
jgi:hypothetical protein